MHISIEISMYPLSEEPYPQIDAFLEKLHRQAQLEVRTSVMSTQIFGDAELVFKTLQEAITQVYETERQCPFVLKVLNGNVSNMTLKNYGV